MQSSGRGYPEGYGALFDGHRWVTPPRRANDDNRYAVVGKPEGLSPSLSAAYDSLAAAGEVSLREFTDVLGSGRAEAWGTLVALAGKGALRDVSSIASERAAVWKEECQVLTEIAASGRIHPNDLIRAALENGLRIPRVNIHYLSEAGLLDRIVSGARVVYDLPRPDGNDSGITASLLEHPLAAEGKDWTSPPVTTTDNAFYAAVRGFVADSDDRVSRDVISMLTKKPMGCVDLARALPHGMRAMRRSMTRLAARGGVTDVSENAVERAIAWFLNCKQMLEVVETQGRMSISGAVATGKEVGVRAPRLACIYLAERDRIVERKLVGRPVYMSTAAAKADQDDAPATVNPPESSGVSMAASMTEFVRWLEIRPFTAVEMMEHLPYGRANIYLLVSKLAFWGKISISRIMGETYYSLPSDDEETTLRKLVAAERLPDPTAIRERIETEMRDGNPLNVLRTAVSLEVRPAVVRWVLDRMVAEGAVRWDEPGSTVVKPEAVVMNHHAQSLRSARYRAMLVAAERMEEFTSIDMNTLLDNAGVPMVPGMSYCHAMADRGYFEALNPDVARQGTGVRRIYRLTKSGRELSEKFKSLPELVELGERIDALLVETSDQSQFSP